VIPPGFQVAAALLAAVPTAVVVLVVAVRIAAYVIAPAEQRPIIRKARRIRRSWRRTATRVGLAHTE